MTTIPNFLNQQGTLKVRTGYDGYGKRQIDSGVTVDCRFTTTSETATDTTGIIVDKGAEFTADVKLYVKPTQTISLEDIFTIDGVDYTVVKIYQPRWIDGSVNHKKCLLVQTSETGQDTTDVLFDENGSPVLLEDNN